eukprot:2795375-Lingulodinium_polyedra.AAC.1
MIVRSARMRRAVRTCVRIRSLVLPPCPPTQTLPNGQCATPMPPEAAGAGRGPLVSGCQVACGARARAL